MVTQTVKDFMTTPQINIYDAITGETVVRDMNETELAQHAKDLADFKKETAAQTKADQAKADKRQIILDRLGITHDELKAILS
jgi:hypothetical protein